LKQFTPALGMMMAAMLFVMLGAASIAGIADAGQQAPSPSTPAMASPTSPSSSASAESALAAALPSEPAATASPTASESVDPTVWPVTTPPRPSDSPTPDPTATPTPIAKPTPVPYRDTVSNARIYTKNRIGAYNYGCIDKIFAYESKWNPRAGTPSGAYGIPQAKPGSKMAAFGANWRYSPLTQVKWGIWYVNSRYGSACSAYAHIQSTGWY
jgi:hypothetical protein